MTCCALKAMQWRHVPKHHLRCCGGGGGCRVTWVIMVPTVLPFFLDACEADSLACGALTHLCCSGEAYPRCASPPAPVVHDLSCMVMP